MTSWDKKRGSSLLLVSVMLCCTIHCFHLNGSDWNWGRKAALLRYKHLVIPALIAEWDRKAARKIQNLLFNGHKPVSTSTATGEIEQYEVLSLLAKFQSTHYSFQERSSQFNVMWNKRGLVLHLKEKELQCRPASFLNKTCWQQQKWVFYAHIQRIISLLHF